VVRHCDEKRPPQNGLLLMHVVQSMQPEINVG
jgi:hypothetical protein